MELVRPVTGQSSRDPLLRLVPPLSCLTLVRARLPDVDVVEAADEDNDDCAGAVMMETRGVVMYGRGATAKPGGSCCCCGGCCCWSRRRNCMYCCIRAW